jgi:hypothetical protein
LAIPPAPPWVSAAVEGLGGANDVCRGHACAAKAFSSEVDAGSRQENASKQEIEPPFRFNRNGKGSGA